MSRPVVTNELEYRRALGRDVAELKRRGKGGITRGTSEFRDILYPPPVTASERGVLASRQVHWFNTESSWWESYYTNTGEVDLTVPGLTAGAAPGWYPTPGNGPRAVAVGTAAQARSAGLAYSLWSLTGLNRFVNGAVGRRITLVTGTWLQTPMAGNYRLRTRFGVQAGAGTAVIGFYRNIGAPTGYITLQPTTLNGVYGQSEETEVSLQATLGAQFGVVVQVGTLSVGGADINTAQLELEYVSPPFAI